MSPRRGLSNRSIHAGGVLYPLTSAHGGAIHQNATVAFGFFILQRMPKTLCVSSLLWRGWEQRSAREVAAAIGTTEKSVERFGSRGLERSSETLVEGVTEERRRAGSSYWWVRPRFASQIGHLRT